jgi:hypothetical protein
MTLIRKDWSRRRFLGSSSAAVMAAMAAGSPIPALLSGCGAKPPSNTSADTVILLWMAGGMAHTETFDPKAYTPFEKGMEANRVLSTFPSIPTALDGIRFSEGLSAIGKVMDRGTLIRSYVAADLGHILHTRHQYHWGVDRERKRPLASSDPGLHRYWSAVHGGGRRGIKGVSFCRIPGE